MTRIANRAGVNKERLYAYFGDKDALFEPARRRAFVGEAAQRLAGRLPG